MQQEGKQVSVFSSTTSNRNIHSPKHKELQTGNGGIADSFVPTDSIYEFAFL